jgi:hypothetical protein
VSWGLLRGVNMNIRLRSFDEKMRLHEYNFVVPNTGVRVAFHFNIKEAALGRNMFIYLLY